MHKSDKAKREQSTSIMENDKNRPLNDYTTPSARGRRSSIVKSPIDADNFELNPVLIAMIQQNQFRGAPMDNPYLQLEVFLEYFEMIKSDGVSVDVIRLRSFPFSIRDKARVWLHSRPLDGIIKWD